MTHQDLAKKISNRSASLLTHPLTLEVIGLEFPASSAIGCCSQWPEPAYELERH